MVNQPDPITSPLATIITDYLVKGGGILAVVLVVLKAAVPKIKDWYQVLAELKQLIQEMPLLLEHTKDISNVSKELTTNGGASVKDAILRIEASNIRNEELLSRIVAKQNRLWKNSPSCLFYMDASGSMTEVNDALLHLVDRNEEELLRMGWLNSIILEKRRQVWEEWEQAILQQRTFEIATFLQLEPTAVPVLIRAVPLIVGGNTVIGYDGTIKLISVN